jgi:hypothetical protein
MKYLDAVKETPNVGSTAGLNYLHGGGSAQKSLLSVFCVNQIHQVDILRFVPNCARGGFGASVNCESPVKIIAGSDCDCGVAFMSGVKGKILIAAP